MKIKLHAYQPKIIVVGSSSMDFVLKTEENPIIGETIMAYQSESYFGGKGANEAVAVSRLGADAYFVGCVGMDPMGQQIMHHLVDEKVNVGYLAETSKVPTGVAYVTASTTDNTIVIEPGANNNLYTKYISRAEKHFHTADLVLVQLEIPMQAVEYTVQLAKKHRKKVVLYASPGKRVSSDILNEVDFIMVKRRSVHTVFGEELSDELFRKYPNKLFVRQDHQTTYYDGDEVITHADNSQEIVHKMGMGDAFVAGFSIARCHSNSIDDGVKFGNYVAVQVSQQRGSQKGLPYLKDIK